MLNVSGNAVLDAAATLAAAEGPHDLDTMVARMRDAVRAMAAAGLTDSSFATAVSATPPPTR